MYWGVDLAKAIMALNDRNERFRLMTKYLDSMSLLETSLNVRQDTSKAFRNYELLIDASTIFEDEPEVAERILGIMCECVCLHAREIKKCSDAITLEPNRRRRVPLKNLYGCLSSDFTAFTNRIEWTYFPRIKSHGLPLARHEYWRHQFNVAYEVVDK